MADKNLITVAEYAKIRGCSTAAVYKRLETTLKPYSKTVNKKIYLSRQILIDEGLSTVENQAGENSTGPQRLNPTVSNLQKPFGNDEESIASQAIKVLEGQLIAKDQEIARLHKEIEDLKEQLNDAMKHNQEHTDKLTELLAQSNELNRNNQILLAQAQDPKQPEQLPEQIQEPEKKKSWFRTWFFGE